MYLVLYAAHDALVRASPSWAGLVHIMYIYILNSFVYIYILIELLE